MVPLKLPYNLPYFTNILVFSEIQTFLHPYPIFSTLPSLKLLTSRTQKFKFWQIVSLLIIPNPKWTQRAHNILNQSLSWPSNCCIHTLGRCCLQVLWFGLHQFGSLEPKSRNPPQITQKVRTHVSMTEWQWQGPRASEFYPLESVVFRPPLLDSPPKGNLLPLGFDEPVSSPRQVLKTNDVLETQRVNCHSLTLVPYTWWSNQGRVFATQTEWWGTVYTRVWVALKFLSNVCLHFLALIANGSLWTHTQERCVLCMGKHGRTTRAEDKNNEFQKNLCLFNMRFTFQLHVIEQAQEQKLSRQNSRVTFLICVSSMMWTSVTQLSREVPFWPAGQSPGQERKNPGWPAPNKTNS